MKIKNEKAALQAFCENDDHYRPLLCNPYFNMARNEVWATDGRALLMVDPKLLRRKYKESDYGKELTIPEKNSDTIVTLKDIESAFHRFQLTPEMVEKEGDECKCPECGGSGEVEWEYTDDNGETYYMDSTCPVCSGFGKTTEIINVPTGRMLPPKDALLVIDNVQFDARNIMKAVEGLRLLGCDKLHHIFTAKDSPNLFEVQDGIRLLVQAIISKGTCRKVKTINYGFSRCYH